MATVQNRLLTSQEYLALERRAEFRSEFYRGEMFAMSGASWKHTLIKDNIASEAGNQLEDRGHALTSDLRVKVAANSYTYPDVVIVCAEPQFEDEFRDTLLNPRVIVEVLSDSTEKYDRGAKFAHYRQVPSVEEYVLVAQDRPLVERYVRQADASWLLTAFNEMALTFAFASIPVRIALADIYRNVKLPESPER